MTHPRHPAYRAIVLAVLAAVLLSVTTAEPARAATYQYWGYYQLAGGTWTFVQRGPAQTDPADGSIEGWRWAIAEESGTPPRTPRVVPSFEQLCGTDPAPAGTKRVGVVVDYGRAADGDGTTTPPEPVGACAVVPTAATGADVLAAVASVRTGDAGLVCGVNDYPASGCGGAVTSLTDEQQAVDTSVTLAAAADTDQSAPPSSPTPGAGPLVPTETAGPVVSPATTPAARSGVPVVVWVGLVILLLGVAALVWTAMQRRREDA